MLAVREIIGSVFILLAIALFVDVIIRIIKNNKKYKK